NDGGGNIGGNANLNFNLSGDPGDLTTQGEADFQIFNGNGGTIGGNAMIDVTAGNITANSLATQIDNTGGTIGGNAGVTVDISGAVNSQKNADFSIFSGSGHINGDAMVSVSVSGDITATGTLSSTIFSVANGNIDGSAAIGV